MTSRRHRISLLVAVAIFSIALAGHAATDNHAASDNKDKQQGRLLLGKVLDKQDNPVVNAIVYLTNMRTHAVKTYIVGQDGTYRFPGLSNVDYEVYAQENGRKSDSRSVSQFDDRSQIYIDLRIKTP